MGYTYALTYRLLGNSPLLWQIYSFVLKTIGGGALFGIMRLIWPEKRQAATTAALLYIIYPGFLSQPNAGTLTNQQLSLTAALFSIWLSGLALGRISKGKRFWLIMGAAVLGLLNFLLYEYMIGLEVLRACVLWLVRQQSARLKIRDQFRRFLGDGVPYLVIGLVFLIWRLGSPEPPATAVMPRAVSTGKNTELN